MQHDFLYCGASAEASSSYLIGMEPGRGGSGIISFLQNRLGEPAVMKEHFTMYEGKVLPDDESSKEFDCLKKMGMLIGHYKCTHHDEHYSSESISLQAYIPGEALHHYLIQDDTGPLVKYKLLTEEKKIKVGIALARGLKNVLDKGITHGDVTPKNIQIQENAKAQITATFIDFGLSQIEKSPLLYEQREFANYYEAPELLQACHLHKQGMPQAYPYSDKSDIYALGVIFKDIGIAPNLARKMTHKNPKMRPDIKEVMAALSKELKTLEEMYEVDDDPKVGWVP